MSHTAIFAFVLIMSIGIVTPGPTVLLALTNASRFGLRHAIFGMAGAVLADIVLVSLVGLGFGTLLAASEMLFNAIKWLGVAWLAYVAWSLLRTAGGSVLISGAAGKPSGPAAFMKSFAVAMGNPKYYLFMCALLPQFVTPGQPQFPQYLTLGAVVVILDVLAMLGYAMLGIKSISLWSAAGVKWINRISGVTLLALAGSIAVYKKANA